MSWKFDLVNCYCYVITMTTVCTNVSPAQAPGYLGCLEYEEVVASPSYVLLNGQTIQEQDKVRWLGLTLAGSNEERQKSWLLCLETSPTCWNQTLGHSGPECTGKGHCPYLNVFQILNVCSAVSIFHSSF